MILQLWENEVVFSGDECIREGWPRNNHQVLKGRKALAILYRDGKIVNLAYQAEEELTVWYRELDHYFYGIKIQQKTWMNIFNGFQIWAIVEFISNLNEKLAWVTETWLITAVDY